MSQRSSDLDPSMQPGLFNLDTNNLLKRFIRNWYWILLFGILGFVLGRKILQETPNIYSVSSKILIDNNKQSAGVGQKDYAISLSPFATGSYLVTNEVEILKSRRLMKEVVSNLGLLRTYYEHTIFGSRELWNNVPFQLEFDKLPERLKGRSLEIERLDSVRFRLTLVDQMNPESWEGFLGKKLTVYDVDFLLTENRGDWDAVRVNFSDPEAISRNYLGNLSVSNLKRSEIIILSLKDPYPERAKLVLSELARVYDAYLLENNRLSTRTTIKFIDLRLTNISEELFDVEKEVEQFKKKINVPLDLNSSTSSFLQKIQTQDEEYAQLQLQQSLLVELKSIVNQGLESYDYLPYGNSFHDVGTSASLIDRYNEMVTERNRLLISAREENPQVIVINDELRKRRENVKEWIAVTEKQIRTKLDFTRSLLDPIESQVKDIPQFERELLQILRQQKIKESLFTYLLQRREETAIALAAEVTNIRQIDLPAVDRLVSPQANRVYLMGIMGMFFIPVIVIFFREIMDDTISAETELDKHITVPFLGFIVQSKNQSSPLIKDERSSIAETFRLVRTNLGFLLGESSRVILMTSFKSGEGKTFMSINLAASLVSAGKSVAIVEIDMRKPKLSKYLGFQNTTGFSIYLNRIDISLEEIKQTLDGVDGLDFYTAGPIPPNPAELLGRDRMSEALLQLKAKYDYVILDSPPVGVVADSLLLTHLVDVSLLVSKAKYTKKRELEFLNSYVKDGKLRNAGLVLNGVRKGSKKAYYGSYGSYYDDESTSTVFRLKNFFERFRR